MGFEHAEQSKPGKRGQTEDDGRLSTSAFAAACISSSTLWPRKSLKNPPSDSGVADQPASCGAFLSSSSAARLTKSAKWPADVGARRHLSFQEAFGLLIGFRGE